MRLHGPGILKTATLLLYIIYATGAIAQEPAYANNKSSYDDSIQANNIFFDAVKAGMKGDEKQAKTLYQLFITKRPDVAAAYYELAKISISEKNKIQAEQYIEKAISLDSTNKWYTSLYGDMLAADGKYEAAAVIFKKLANTESYNEDYLLRAAIFYERAGKVNQALDQYNKLLVKTGNDEDVLVREEDLYLKMKNVDGAVNVAKQLIAQNPREGKYYVLLGDLYDNNKQPEKAADVYKNALKLLPDDPAVQLGLAGHYQKNKDTARYEEYVEKTILNKSLDAETQLSLLQPYLSNMRNDSTAKKEALYLVSHLADMHPANAQVQAVYGDLFMINNEDSKAAEQYKKSINIDPSKFSVWEQLLYSYSGPQDADSLIKYARRAIRLYPTQALVHYLYGVGEMNKKDYQAAAASINRAIELQPDDNKQLLGQMYATLGDVYNSLKDYNLSDSAFSKALALNPDDATTLNNFGYYLSERGARLDVAEKMSKRSLDLRPEEPTFLDTYGWILYKMGNYELAKAYVQRAIDANPANADPTVYEHLGDIYFKLNNKDKALEYWIKAKGKGDTNPDLLKKIQEKRIYE